jgi:guanidinopropionase
MSTPDAVSKSLESFAASYQHWFGPSTFLRCPYRPDLAATDIGVIGVPYAGGNPVEHMQYLGPRAIRNKSMGYARTHREFGINPFALARISDLGDVPMPNLLHPDLAADDSEAFFKKVFQAQIVPVSVGGDHSITWPILRAARATRFAEPLGIIHFDSHSDAIPPMFGTRNHAGGFRIGAEDGVIDPRRTIQIGIRGPMGEATMDDWARENFAAFITTESFLEQGPEAVIEKARATVGEQPTYLTFDLDVLDPSDAPGVADPEIDGIRIREILKVIRGLPALNLMGADIVCYCPPLDNPCGITALTASLLLLEFVTIIAENIHRTRR